MMGAQFNVKLPLNEKRKLDRLAIKMGTSLTSLAKIALRLDNDTLWLIIEQMREEEVNLLDREDRISA